MGLHGVGTWHQGVDVKRGLVGSSITGGFQTWLPLSENGSEKRRSYYHFISLEHLPTYLSVEGKSSLLTFLLKFPSPLQTTKSTSPSPAPPKLNSSTLSLTHAPFQLIPNPVPPLTSTVPTRACVVPLGTPSSLYHSVAPPFANNGPSAVNTPASVTAAPHTSLSACTAHIPLLLVSVNPPSVAVAVKRAQVPVVYQVPTLMMQPVGLPPVGVTLRVPRPVKGVPGEVVGVEEVLMLMLVLVVVLVLEGGGVLLDLGRYLIPVVGQEDLEPSVGM